jgi:hypothetical protein
MRTVSTAGKTEPGRERGRGGIIKQTLTGKPRGAVFGYFRCSLFVLAVRSFVVVDVYLF